MRRAVRWVRERYAGPGVAFGGILLALDARREVAEAQRKHAGLAS